MQTRSNEKHMATGGCQESLRKRDRTKHTWAMGVAKSRRANAIERKPHTLSTIHWANNALANGSCQESLCKLDRTTNAWPMVVTKSWEALEEWDGGMGCGVERGHVILR